jgi:hypothetical protein
LLRLLCLWVAGKTILLQYFYFFSPIILT